MIALLRYQTAILLRSHRWIFPLIAYVLLVAAVAAEGSTPLAQSLDWSAAMLVPVTAFLTRAMLTAEPDATRACVAAATGPMRAQFATVSVALGGGALLGLGGACADIVLSEAAVKPLADGTLPGVTLAGKITAVGHHPAILAAGLLTAVVCLFVGCAIGALLNPPLLRHPGAAMLATLAAAIFGVASTISPAGAALRHVKDDAASPLGTLWPGTLPLIAAACLLAAAWTASLLVAARRDNRATTG